MYCIAFITQTVPDLFHYSELIHWYCSEEKSLALFEMIDYEVFFNEKNYFLLEYVYNCFSKRKFG